MRMTVMMIRMRIAVTTIRMGVVVTRIRQMMERRMIRISRTTRTTMRIIENRLQFH